MKQVCELLSIVCGIALALVCFLNLSPQVGVVVSELNEWKLCLWLGAIALVGLATIATVQALLLATGVLLTRGPKAIGWVDPVECRSFGNWVSYRWRYFSTGGQQEGFRFLGMEVAFVGQL